MKPVFAVILVLFLLPSSLHALDCPKVIGWAILKSAWPTPEYTSCEFERIEPTGNGNYNVLIKVTGASRISLLDDKEIWVRAVAEVGTDPWAIKSVSWRDYFALFPPQGTYEMLSEQ